MLHMKKKYFQTEHIQMSTLQIIMHNLFWQLIKHLPCPVAPLDVEACGCDEDRCDAAS